MPTVYFVKDGPRPDNSGPGFPISMPDLEARVRGQEVKYLGIVPPQFNPDQPSRFATKHVVIEVEPTEATGAVFKRQGFYLLPQLKPKEASQLIFPQGLPPISP